MKAKTLKLWKSLLEQGCNIQKDCESYKFYTVRKESNILAFLDTEDNEVTFNTDSVQTLYPTNNMLFISDICFGKLTFVWCNNMPTFKI